jgi:hypothetical protein
MYRIEEAKCPYCNSSLKVQPKRKMKCKNCGKDFYVKTRCDQTKVIITEDELEKIEQEWNDYNFCHGILSLGSIPDWSFQEAKTAVGNNKPDFEIAWELLNKKLLRLIDDESCIEAGKIYIGMALYKQRELLPQVNGDIIWGLFNKKLESLMKPNDWSERRQTYSLMARFVHAEGKDNFYLLQEAMKCELQGFKVQGFEKVEIFTGGHGNSCKACYALNGKQFTIETALRIMPIPVQSCRTEVYEVGQGYCRCFYRPVIN